MKLRKFPIFFEGEDDSFSGSGDTTPPPSGDNDTSGGGNTPPANTPPPAPTIDASAFAKEFGSVIAEQFKQRDSAQPKAPPTEAELAAARKNLNFWEPDDTFLQEFGNAETQKAAILKMRDGMMGQFVTIAKALLEQQNESWNGKFQPVQQMLTQREEAERESRFHTTYPVLAKPELKPMIAAVAQQLAAQNKFQGLNEAQAFAALASGVETVIKSTYPEFTLGASAPANQGRQGNGIPSSSTGSGGGGGAGASRGNQASKPIAAQILGPVRAPKR